MSVALVRLYLYYIFAGGSLPDKLDRHPWYLDFPRWHDTRKGNSDRTFASAAQLKAATMQYDVSLLNLKLHFLSTYVGLIKIFSSFEKHGYFKQC